MKWGFPERGVVIVATSKIAFVTVWNNLVLFEADKFTWLFEEKKGKERMSESRNGRHKESDSGNVDKKAE
jgi:hypothetical protein